MTSNYELNYIYINEIYLKEIPFENIVDSTDFTISGYYNDSFEKTIMAGDFSIYDINDSIRINIVTNLLIKLNKM